MNKFEFDFDEVAKGVGLILKPQFEEQLKDILQQNLSQNELLGALLDYSVDVSGRTSIAMLMNYHEQLSAYLEANLKD